jgi:hypothetical protein
VEPEPVVYARLAAVANLMRAGLEGRGLLAPDVGDVLDRLIEMYRRFERLARDELAGAPISAEDNLWLETIASRFELIWLLAGEDIEESGAQTGGFPESPNDIAAVIADIMSNPWEALEVGTGYIDRIYVLVPNDQGSVPGGPGRGLLLLRVLGAPGPAAHRRGVASDRLSPGPNRTGPNG